MGVHRYTLLDEGPAPKRRFVRFCLFMLTVAVLTAIVVPTCLSYAKKQDVENKIDGSASHANGTALSPFGNNPGTFSPSEGVTYNTAHAVFFFRITGIDPIAETARCRLTMGSLSEDEKKQANLENVGNYQDIFDGSYLIIVNGEEKKINSSSLSYEWTYPITMFGDSSKYPFDTYSDNFSFIFLPNQELENGITSELYAFGSQVGWDIKLETTYEHGGYTIKARASRQTATKGFSLFVVILSWILSLCQFFISAQSLIRNRAIIPPLLAVPAALLFALPSLRNIQPGIPPIGIVLDIAGFYWNMALVAISLITSCILFIFQFEVTKPS